jgi:hypothetical protein
MGKWCRRSLIVAALCSDLNPVASPGASEIEPNGARRDVLRAFSCDANGHSGRSGDEFMFDFQDLFQWDRFITPTIIKTFYWLVIVLTVLFGISGIFSGLAAMAISPFGGFILVLSSLASIVVGIIFSRIVAEFILIVFRINEHLGAIRDQGQLH